MERVDDRALVDVKYAEQKWCKWVKEHNKTLHWISGDKWMDLLIAVEL